MQPVAFAALAAGGDPRIPPVPEGAARDRSAVAIIGFPPETSVAFDMLVAPSKKLVWFEEPGHERFVDEPVKDASTNVHPSGAV